MLTTSFRPHVILNIAATADGKTDTVDRKGAAISSEEDMLRVDKLRADVDGIMVGGRTLLENDPRLTIKTDAFRLERERHGLAPNPVKIGVVTKADLDLTSRFLTYGPAQVMIFTTRQTEAAQIEKLEGAGARVFVLGERQVDLASAMQLLWKNDIKTVLVEGGGTLNESLLNVGLVDEIYLYIAPMIFGGSHAPTFVDGQGLSRGNAIRLNLLDLHPMADGGIVLHYRPDYRK